MIDQSPLSQDEIDILMESMNGAHDVPGGASIPKPYYKVKKLGHLDGDNRRTYWYIRNRAVKKLQKDGFLVYIYSWIQWSEVSV